MSKRQTPKPPSPKPFVLHKGSSTLAYFLFMLVTMAVSLTLWVLFIKWAVAL